MGALLAGVSLMGLYGFAKGAQFTSGLVKPTQPTAPIIQSRSNVLTYVAGAFGLIGLYYVAKVIKKAL